VGVIFKNSFIETKENLEDRLKRKGYWIGFKKEEQVEKVKGRKVEFIFQGI
jgi:hypothetical protein